MREAEVLQSQGMSVEEAARTLEIAPQTYYRWRKEYGDMNTTQARKLNDLESAREAYQQSLDMFTEMDAPGYIQVLEERLGDL